MIRGYEDLIVGVGSFGLGLFLVICAAVNWQWYYTLRSARFLESKLGRTGARVLHGLLGAGLIALGIAIALGWRFPVF